jgi:lipopolysaccharide/colanic/teichoic acid biosynthesis glycosyltransferase
MALLQEIRKVEMHPVRLDPAHTTTSNGWYDFAKRSIDLIFASLALVLVMPLMLVLGVIIKLTDGGPILFTQTRVGRHGKQFRCYKLRSMVDKADRMKLALVDKNQHSDPRTFKMVGDPRVTRIGQLLRKTSLDEAPQLLNVILGDMSLVGPRPPVPSEVAGYSDLDFRRLEVRPGLTCIWQISGRADIPFARQVQLDIDYIEQRSLWLDTKLMLKTIPAVISGRGAY